MDVKTLMLQIVHLQKASFDNGYQAMVAIQDQTEKIFGAFIDQSPWLPSDSRASLSNMFKMNKKTRDDFKKLVDDGYNHLGGYIDSAFGSILH